MKKILIISLGKANGGTEKYINDLYKYISKEKYELYFLVRKNTALCEQLKKTTNYSDSILMRDFNSMLKEIIFLRKFIKRQEISLIHANGILANFLSVILAFRLNFIKRIVTIHGDARLDRIDKPRLYQNIFVVMEVMLAQFNDLYIAVSNSIKNRLISKHISEKKIRVIYNGVNVYNVQRKNEIKSTIKICSIGRLEKVKDHLTLIKGIESFKRMHPSIKILCDIYGDGSNYNELIDYINMYNLRQEIFLKGHLHKAYRVIHDYDIFIQSSLYETFGLSIVEAMIEKTPVIATNTGGVKEIINNGENGLLFEIGDHHTMACLIYKLIADNTLYQRLQINGYKVASKNFNIMENMLALEYLYDELTVNRRMN